MSLCSSYRRITTNLLPPSIFKTRPVPVNPLSFPISPIHQTKPLSSKPHHLSKSFTVRSSSITQPSSPDPSLHNPSNLNNIFEQLPQNLQHIINLFQSVQDPKAKYEQLLFYGKNLKPLDTQFKTEENKVKGCVSQVWLRAYFDNNNNNNNNKNVIFEADSDALITKGLAALLVQGLSGSSVEDILKISPDFIVLLGLQQSLSPSRNNGFLNMFQLMQKKALMLFVEAEKGVESRSVNFEDPGMDIDSGESGSRSFDARLSNGSGDDEISSSGSGGSGLGNRGQRIREILNKELQPVELELEDVSYQHAGHVGVKGSDGETHFNLRVVSKEFEGKSMVKRHRMIYSLLDGELQSGLHALSIEAKTPAEVGG